MNKNTRLVCLTALGIALYAVLSFLLRSPSSATSVLTSAISPLRFTPAISVPSSRRSSAAADAFPSACWPTAGFRLGNILIGLVCGKAYAERKFLRSFVVTVIAVFIGICGVKTIVECLLFSIPVAVKLPKNAIAALVDAAVMTIGLCIAPRVKVGDCLARA